MLDLIKRNTPEIASLFVTEVIEKHEGLSLYEIEAINDKVILRGDCTISLAMAYYRYLKDYCGVNMSWCGNTVPSVENAPLPVSKITHRIIQDKRVYMNSRAFSYSACWWDWARWEREIDYMAMNGINMPLSFVGSEAVWYYTLRDFKYSEQGALQFLSGPAFWSWQLMANIDSFLALTDVKYIESRLELGKKILNRQRELGMSPIMPGYTGHIPRTMLRLFRKARIRSMPSWNNFSTTYRIDSNDALFTKFGNALLEKQLRLLGGCHHYACDPFHDNFPKVHGDEYLKATGKAIAKLLNDFDSESVWVIQGDCAREPLIKHVRKEKLLILDLDGTGYGKTDGFWGYDFIYGTHNNYGAHNALHGSIAALAANGYLQVKEAYPNAVGTGLFPEGMEQNPLYYDLASEMLTESKPKDPELWLHSYALRRYGSNESCLSEALMKLKTTCYGDNCTGRETGSIVCARPGTELKHTSIGDTLELRYDNKDLLEAAEALLNAKKAAKDGYAYDVCDVVRQVLSNHARVYYSKAVKGYSDKDPRAFEMNSNAFLRLLEDLDRLLQTREELTLIKRLRDANAAAIIDGDKQNFEINVLTQFAVWGPMNDTVLYDNAWREWGGLTKTFYAMRWRMFFEMLAGSFKGMRRVSTTTRKQIYDRNAHRGSGFYKNLERAERHWIASCRPEEVAAENTVVVARELITKYRKSILDEE